MFTKLARVARFAQTATRYHSKNVMRCMGSQAADVKLSSDIAIENKMTYNDMPQPEGDWQEDYNKIQSKYNMYLGASIVALIGTIFVMKQAGVFLFHITPNLKRIEVDSTKLE